jgi:hypothetical protein
MAGIGHNNPSVSVEGLSPEDKKVLKKAIMELDDSFRRVDAERDLQKEIIAATFDKLGVEKKLIRRLANSYHKANFKDEVESNNTFETFYEEVVEKVV